MHVPVNVIHIHATAGSPNAAGAMAALEASVNAQMWNSVWNAIGITSVNIIPLDGVSPTTTFTTSGGAKWAGTQTGEGTPQVAAIIKVSTGLRGRNRRGRVYLPYTGEAANSGGALITSVQSSLQTGWNTFLSSLAAVTPNPYNFGVASYERAHGGAGAGFYAATSVTAELYTATQRRRQPGRKVSRH